MATTTMITSTLSTLLSNDFVGKEGMEQYLWLIVLGGFVCFAMAWGIGANDCANAFGTSVGSKALSLKQAVVIAGIFEFCGAVGLGSAVAETVRKGIADYTLYEGEEDILMLGMFCALLTASLWLYLATKYSLPVSTTQAIVGGIAGFAIASKGTEGVVWESVWLIIIFWIATPVLSCVSMFIFFGPIRWLIRQDNAYEKVIKLWPFFVFIVAFIMTIFLFVKGLKRLDWAFEENVGMGLGITLAVSIFCAVVSYFAFIYTGVIERFVDRQIEKEEKEAEEMKSNANASDNEPIIISNVSSTNAGDNNNDEEDKDKEKDRVIVAMEVVSNNKKDVERVNSMSRTQSIKERLTRGVNVDVTEDLDELSTLIQTKAEQFPRRVEHAFASLQVCTASLDLFAHGSNDVANAVAPFASMLVLYQTGKANQETLAIPYWILAMCAVGMVVGLATYGYKIIKVLGVQMAGMSSCRGYCIELSSALVVILASSYGLPTSTTHAQVGATVGAGIMEIINGNTELSWKQVVNWVLLAQVFLGWIATLFVSGITSGLLFSILAYSPYDGDVLRGCD